MHEGRLTGDFPRAAAGTFTCVVTPWEIKANCANSSAVVLRIVWRVIAGAPRRYGGSYKAIPEWKEKYGPVFKVRRCASGWGVLRRQRCLSAVFHLLNLLSQPTPQFFILSHPFVVFTDADVNRQVGGEGAWLLAPRPRPWGTEC